MQIYRFLIICPNFFHTFLKMNGKKAIFTREVTKKDEPPAHPFCFPILLTCKKHYLFSFYVAKIGILNFLLTLSF